MKNLEISQKMKILINPKMAETNLYILTSRRTFSATAKFTYGLKNLHRAIVIGETIGGGAHPCEYQYIRELNVQLKISHGRSFNPKTGLDWEGTGIIKSYSRSVRMFCHRRTKIDPGQV